jgi:hypothetical protein
MGKRLAALILLPALLLASAAGANSNTFGFTQAQVVAKVPENWTIQNEGGNVTFASKDKLVAISLAHAGSNLDEAWRILTEEVDKVVTGLKVAKTPGKVSAFSGYIGTGTGKLGNTDVDCYLAAVMTPGGAMTVFRLFPVGKAQNHKQTIDTFLNNLAPARK